jgi:hypothetical protein
MWVANLGEQNDQEAYVSRYDGSNARYRNGCHDQQRRSACCGLQPSPSPLPCGPPLAPCVASSSLAPPSHAVIEYSSQIRSIGSLAFEDQTRGNFLWSLASRPALPSIIFEIEIDGKLLRARLFVVGCKFRRLK